MAVMIEARSFRPFKSSEEYLYAMKEDLAEWLNTLYPELMINVDNFMDRLDTGVALCKHANNVRASALEHNSRRAARGLASKGPAPPPVPYLPAARPSTFFARDNVSNFISWCRNSLGIFECLLFETDDLIMRKNEKHVILCLLEVARKGSKFGMLAPMLVQMERQIDREILADARKAGQGGCEEDEEDEDEGVGGGAPAAPMMYGPMPQIVTNDLKSLDEMVRDLVERCSCPTQFPMIRVSEGKYRIGDTKVLIFVRVLRSHVMVRVGGGWDTLSHYLDKHDPCRCRAQHRPTLGARVIQRYPPANNGQCMELTGAEVHYDRSPPRTRRSSVSSVGSSGGGSPQHTSHLGPPQHTAARQRSRSPAGPSDRGYTSLPYMGHANNAFENQAFNHYTADQAYKQNKYNNRRSVSPSPARKVANRTQSPNPQRKTSMQNYPQLSSTVYNNPALVPSSTLVPNPHRSNRSRSPTPKTQNYLTVNAINGQDAAVKNIQEKDDVATTNDFEHTNDLNTMDNTVNGSENASDNGSEVSDEGYRSLGIIQNGSALIPSGISGNTKDETDRGLNLKLNRLSLNSQASTEDADLSERTELLTSETTLKRQQSSSDCSSQMSTTEDRIKGSDDSPGSVYNDRICSDRQKSPVVEVSCATGLRKTNYSETLYGDKKPATPVMERKHVRNVSSPVVCLDSINAPSQNLKNAPTSKIPQSPILQRRRLSMENLSPTSRSRSASRDRYTPRDRSASRDPSAKRTSPTGKNVNKPPVPTNSPTHSAGSFGKVNGAKAASTANNTWNGGRAPAAKGKLRPPVTNDTFVSPPGGKNLASKVSSPPFQRNSNIRSSTSALRANSSGYDNNGRRIKSPLNTPVKTANRPFSPLLETILKTAENAQDDAMMLEKMKDIIKQYSGILDSEKPSSPIANDMDDFTSAWVRSNGTLERSQSSRQLRDSLNNCSVATPTLTNGDGDSAAYESGGTSSGFKSTALVSKIPMFSSSPRRDSKSVGITSRIPAPVSYKKTTDYFD